MELKHVSLVLVIMNSCDNCSKECPYTEQCLDERNIGEGVSFERLRRITGYLVGTIDRWNNGKLAELKDRVKHGTSNSKEE